MKTVDLVATAFANVFRSRTRTLLTVLAIFVGAFTLTLTSGLGTGINRYMSTTVAAIGSPDILTVTKTSTTSSGLAVSNAGPAVYDPAAVANEQPGPTGGTVSALTQQDLDTIAGIQGVLSVEPVKSISPDFIQAGNGTPYVVSVGSQVTGQKTQLAAGTDPSDSSDHLQLVLPVSYVEPLGFADNQAALGQTVTLQITDGSGTPHAITADIVGIAQKGLASPTTGAGIVPNQALADALYTAQNTGVPAARADRYAKATIRIAPDATTSDVTALKDRLAAVGYTATTVADQLGMFTTVIDGIVLVLNAFAVIALVAAGFGIVNTLFMSVQERTREIGLMKATGMGSGRVFGLFSLEAVAIGLLGSVLGVAVAAVAGTALSTALAGSVLSGLPGLTLIAFDPMSVATVIGLVVAIAFLAGTLPAARAAGANPVDSLRYE